MKKFEAKDLDSLQSLLGQKIHSVLYQPTDGTFADGNMLVINFGQSKIEYYLHIFCFCEYAKKIEFC